MARSRALRAWSDSVGPIAVARKCLPRVWSDSVGPIIVARSRVQARQDRLSHSGARFT